MARTVFKTAEAFARGLVGSIPTLSRQGTRNSAKSRFLRALHESSDISPTFREPGTYSPAIP